MPALMQRAVVHRFFFALMPDQITARRTHAFAECELGSKGLLEPERHHVTLWVSEDFPFAHGALIDALSRAGDSVRAESFGLTLDRLSGSTRTVALRPSRVVPSLRDLQYRIAAAVAKQGAADRPGWSFSPHQTLTYRKGAPFSRPVPGFQWSVSEFVLIHSHVGLHRHDIVGRWPLHPPVEAQGQLL